MSVDEQQLLIQDSTNPSSNTHNAVTLATDTDTESSPSPNPPIQPQPKSGLFSKLRSKSQYSALPIMNENANANLTLTYAQSEQLPDRKLFVTNNEHRQPTTPNNESDKFVHDPESPSIPSTGYLHASYSYSPRSPRLSKDDLDLHTNTRIPGHQPRASAVNPISIPLHVSQRDITLNTDFNIPRYKHRNRRSFSQAQISAASPSSSISLRHKKKEIAHFEEKKEEKKQENEEKKEVKTVFEETIETVETKPPFLKKKTSSHDNEGDIKDKKVSVKDVFNVKNQIKSKKMKLKKDKSVFDAFKKEKKIDLSSIANLPIYLKKHLNDDASDHAIESIISYISECSEEKSEYIYEQLVKDKEFVPLLCNKLLSPNNDSVVCIWLYDFFSVDNANARLFAVQFIPCLIWCVMTRSPKCVSGAVAALLSLYKKECNIFDKLWNEDITHFVHNEYGVRSDHNIFPKFSMPDLDLASIYHEPNNKYSKYKPTAPTIINTEIKINKKIKQNVINKKDYKEIRDSVFPSLNQANLSTNIHLIYVALQVFNHYITLVSKPSICLEQMCAVIAKLCSSGIDASQVNVRFPEKITSHFAWDWKWYNTDDIKDKKQYEKYILPSPIISQFLSSIRYSLKQPKTTNIAKFALAQVHKRGHCDMIPEIILQTTSMLHEAFMDGLTF